MRDEVEEGGHGEATIIPNEHRIDMDGPQASAHKGCRVEQPQGSGAVHSLNLGEADEPFP